MSAIVAPILPAPMTAILFIQPSLNWHKISKLWHKISVNDVEWKVRSDRFTAVFRHYNDGFRRYARSGRQPPVAAAPRECPRPNERARPQARPLSPHGAGPHRAAA